jgi:hypothetical protein
VSTRTAASRPMILLAALSAIALSMIWLVSPAFATHVTPTVIDSNASCGELGDFAFEFKIDETPETKTYSDPNSDFVVDITVNADATEMSFSSNLPVDAVFIKGGTGGGNLYVYDPPVTEDSGLTTPTGQQISHVSFCFHQPPEESESPSAEQSVESSASAEESGEQSVKISTGTPEESTADSSLFGKGSNPLATIAFSLILLASLGGLAYANVKTVRSRI